MKIDKKTIIIGIGSVIVLGVAGYFAYSKYFNIPRLVSKSGQTMTISYRGKQTKVKVGEMSNSKGDISLQLGKWNLTPSYANTSDKKSLNGLHLKKNDVIYNTFYL